MSRFSWTALIAVTLVALTPAASAEHHEGVAAEIKAQIMASNDYTRANLMDPTDDLSKDGSMEFWSSGGLMHWLPADAPSTKYTSMSTAPKHIKVIELPGGESAVAMYYSEGSFQVEGGPKIDHYMTRVMQVFVKEDGRWKVRAAHWSPIAGGSGTSQSTLD